jgi:hypothetical protein
LLASVWDDADPLRFDKSNDHQRQPCPSSPSFQPQDKPYRNGNLPTPNPALLMATPPDSEHLATAAYFQSLATCFVTATGQHGVADMWLRIARRTARLRFAGNRLHAMIAPVFAHLQTPAQQTADLTVLLWDTASTGIGLPPLPARTGERDRAGKLRGLCDLRFTTEHDPDTGQFWMFDRPTATAVVWVNEVDLIPIWDHIHPLRRLLHAWARGFGADLVHAGAVGIDGAGVLVVGPGGTGKSTTVLAAMAAGLTAAGDDYVLVDAGSSPGSPAGSFHGSQSASPPAAHALYGTMRLHQAHLDRFPTLMTQHDHVFDEPWSGRAKVTSYISRHRPDRLTAELRLVGIVIPQVVDHEPPEATRETPAGALLALAPSSLLQVDPTDATMFARLSRLCRLLPCWRLPLGPDPARAAARLARLIREFA